MKHHDFAVAVNAQYERMAKRGELFVARSMNEASEPDDIFAHYLASFPEGTNPIYKTNTEHDCSCCKHFVRNIGRLVSIQDGVKHTVWPLSDVEDPAYASVSRSMDAYVRTLPLEGIFRTKEHSYGAEYSRQLGEGGEVVKWSHFFAKVTGKFRSDAADAAKGTFNTTVQVFRRGLEELRPDALQQVVELIESKALYRGDEHLAAVKQFQKTQQAYLREPGVEERNLFVLSKSEDLSVRFRNSVIGTLVQDLSEGADIERAVASFESKVAPTNYKRTSALITPRMVQDAMKTVRELNLESALQRRLATIADISVNNVLWVDRSIKGRMKGGSIESILMDAASEPVKTSGVKEEVGVVEFLNSILPKAESMEIYLRNTHLSNFMTLTAPLHADAGRLFKWDNPFAWSYDGNITDSIRERVKQAGGNVDAKLRFSLAWFNYDDLDIHIKTPSKQHIYFGNKAGILDVDMNAGFAQTKQPVENMSFVRPEDGLYEVWVNQYNRRESTEPGFTIEVASLGAAKQLSYKKAVRQGENVLVGKFYVVGGAITQAEYGQGILGEGIAVDKWSLKTERLHKVQTVLRSPNYWDANAVGNMHTFFIIEGCRVDGPQRGIYNEFLAAGLERHRKVFEILGDKTKCEPTEEQLSGLGFSSTRADEVTVVVKMGARSRPLNVRF